MELEEVITRRRTCRGRTDRDVDFDVIKRIVKAVRKAEDKIHLDR